MPCSIDVLLPVFNGASTIRDAIVSLQRQTIANFRIVVIDDGSTDETPELLAQLVASSTQISTEQPITFTATVTPSDATGTVTFLEGTTPLGTSALANGTASLTVTLPIGVHTIHAHYSGN